MNKDDEDKNMGGFEPEMKLRGYGRA